MDYSRATAGGLLLLLCCQRVMQQGVRFLGGNKNKFEAFLQLGILRNSVVKLSVTLPPWIGYALSTITFSLTIKPVQETVSGSCPALCFCVSSGMEVVRLGSSFELQYVMDACYVTRWTWIICTYMFFETCFIRRFISNTMIDLDKSFFFQRWTTFTAPTYTTNPTYCKPRKNL